MNNQVSIEEIIKAMDEFETNYFQSIDDIFTDVEEKYNYLKTSGSLTSDKLESTYNAIKKRLQKMKDDFTLTKNNIKDSIDESVSDISVGEKTIEDTLVG